MRTSLAEEEEEGEVKEGEQKKEAECDNEEMRMTEGAKRVKERENERKKQSE